jgi:hypothetical protein
MLTLEIVTLVVLGAICGVLFVLAMREGARAETAQRDRESKLHTPN